MGNQAVCYVSLRDALFQTGASAPLRQVTFVYARLPWRAPFGPAFGCSALLLQCSSGKVTKTIAPHATRRVLCATPSPWDSRKLAALKQFAILFHGLLRCSMA